MLVERLRKEERMYEIVRMVFGSHLYGTSSEESDLDIKGVFIPNHRDVLLGRIKHSYSEKREKAHGEKNTSKDTDIEIFSIQEFIEKACQGQTVALDMLHAPENMIINKNEIWNLIVANREKFYTKNLSAFVDYAQRQAAKYGVKGSRLNSAKKFIDLLKSFNPSTKLHEFWNSIEEDEHSKFINPTPNGIEQFEICGKIFQSTSRVSYVLPIIQTYYDVYGERARLAARNEGIDFKAVSHAIRAALEIKELLTEGTITFPLKEADLVKKIKYGQLDYTTQVCPVLESLIEECRELSENSNLPEQADREYWENFVIETMKNNLLKGVI